MGPIKKIYILHGWAYSTEKWNPFVELLKKNGICAKLLNIPGLTKDSDKVWELNSYVEWLKRNIDLEKNKITLLGHSNGGRIALAFAAKYPENLSSLILLDSAGIYHNQLHVRLKRVVFKAIAKFGKKVTSSEKIKNLVYKIARAQNYRDASPNMKQTMLNLISYDLTPILSKIAVQTVIVWGENDQVTPLYDGKLMHKLIKNSKLIVIKSARHSPQFTHPKEVYEKAIKIQ